MERGLVGNPVLGVSSIWDTLRTSPPTRTDREKFEEVILHFKWFHQTPKPPSELQDFLRSSITSPDLHLCTLLTHTWHTKKKRKKKRILFCCCCCFTFSSKLNWHASWLGSFISLRTRCLRRNSEQQRWKILSRDVIEDVHWALLLSSLFPSFFPFCLKPRDVVEQRLCQTGSLF